MRALGCTLKFEMFLNQIDVSFYNFTENNKEASDVIDCGLQIALIYISYISAQVKSPLKLLAHRAPTRSPILAWRGTSRKFSPIMEGSAQNVVIQHSPEVG